jgi:hypothetical protein
MRFKNVGNKEDIVHIVFRNADTVSIPKGDPVVLNMNATGDGLDCVRANSSAAKSHGLLFGVSLGVYAANDFGEAQVFGFCRALNITRATRGASSDSWASIAAITANNWLNIETVYGGFSPLASSAASYLPFAVVGESFASIASIVSQTSDTRTAVTVQAKGFVRML